MPGATAAPTVTVTVDALAVVPAGLKATATLAGAPVDVRFTVPAKFVRVIVSAVFEFWPCWIDSAFGASESTIEPGAAVTVTVSTTLAWATPVPLPEIVTWWLPAATPAPTSTVTVDVVPVVLVGLKLTAIPFGAPELVNVTAPVPQTQIARITATTDFFLVAGPPATRHLVQHSLPGTGGASGSPIFNAKGEVIAAFNAVNFTFVKQGEETLRAGSAVNVNFGQRADLVTELIEGRAASQTEARQKLWTERLSAFTSATDYIIKQFEGQAKVTGAKPVLDERVVLKPAGAGDPTARVEYAVPGPGHILIMAEALDTTQIAMVVDVNQGANRASSNGTPYVRFLLGPVNGAINAAAVVTSKREGVPVRVRIFYQPAPAAPKLQ